MHMAEGEAVILEDRHYWPKFVAASIAIAVATAVATEGARVLADALRERWKLPPKKENEVKP